MRKDEKGYSDTRQNTAGEKRERNRPVCEQCETKKKWLIVSIVVGLVVGVVLRHICWRYPSKYKTNDISLGN